VKDLILHLFTTREENNHRAKLLHFRVILILILFFALLPFSSSYIKSASGKVLGASTSITPTELLFLTNKDRKDSGAIPLKENENLTQAASKKADDMFLKNYWAHNSPDGKTPWGFIKDAGYNYVYAGENLAKGFSNSKSVIDAWMASTEGHRENMLSSNFEDVGFAVKTGNLNGEETVLVVEEFGGKTLVPIQAGPDRAKEQAVAGKSSITFPLLPSVKINSFSYSGALVMFIIMLFMFAIVLDLIVSHQNKVVRIVGHNLDHLLFFVFIALLVINLAKGAIL
jgi:hypothetical protein